MPAERRLADAEESRLVMALSAMVGQLFVGRDPQIIGAVLAELMATFLLNHQLPDDLPRQETLRKEILDQWCDVVRQLVAVQEPVASERLQ